jgi:hypothetical protein
MQRHVAVRLRTVTLAHNNNKDLIEKHKSPSNTLGLLVVVIFINNQFLS